MTCGGHFGSRWSRRVLALLHSTPSIYARGIVSVELSNTVTQFSKGRAAGQICRMGVEFSICWLVLVIRGYRKTFTPMLRQSATSLCSSLNYTTSICRLEDERAPVDASRTDHRDTRN